MVVPLCERRTGDLSVPAPDLTFCSDHVLPKQINGAIHLDWLWEIAPPGGDLIDGRCIGDPQDNTPGGNCHEGI